VTRRRCGCGRRVGFSYEEIAKRVGFANKGGAWKVVERAQTELEGDAA
jgi:hypothetical protein